VNIETSQVRSSHVEDVLSGASLGITRPAEAALLSLRVPLVQLVFGVLAEARDRLGTRSPRRIEAFDAAPNFMGGLLGDVGALDIREIDGGRGALSVLVTSVRDVSVYPMSRAVLTLGVLSGSSDVDALIERVNRGRALAGANMINASLAELLRERITFDINLPWKIGGGPAPEACRSWLDRVVYEFHGRKWGLSALGLGRIDGNAIAESVRARGPATLQLMSSEAHEADLSRRRAEAITRIRAEQRG
jgi:hypothetical protein